jgi:hypothetical protein
MEKFKNIGLFLMLALYVLGTINGVAYSCYIGEYPTAIGVAVLAVMAFPKAKEYYRKLID